MCLKNFKCFSILTKGHLQIVLELSTPQASLSISGISEAEANHRKEVRQLKVKPPSFTPLGPVIYLSEKQD